ncbi:uncharacterized protein LOC143488888 [Brachyhypopomus gauderio]|uniref:uncharacterized protein LOC143488888 n=1 Tax=Brachyhypopomus gauderio TaxID=698409 RepID=UPI00404198B7
MAAFDIQAFLSCPSVECLDTCKKDQLLEIAEAVGLSLSRQLLKSEIKRNVIEHLTGLRLLGQQVLAPGDVTGAEPPVLAKSEEKLVSSEVQGSKATLPRFDPLSPYTGTGSREDARVRVRVARLEMERQERAQQRQADFDLRIAVRRLELEVDREVRLRELQLKADNASAVEVPVRSHDPSVVFPSTPVSASRDCSDFQVTKHIALVPSFREAEVDTYFSLFERIATSLSWPKGLWTLLLQSKLVGKAQEAYSALSLQESMDYDVVKTAILRAYELVPEAYRQRFRSCRKSDSQTYVEFAREKAQLFAKWLVASHVSSLDSLRELMLLEEFKDCLPAPVVVHLNECKATTVNHAAVLADEFVLTHRPLFVPRSTMRPVPVEQRPKPDPHKRVNSAGPAAHVECYYCHKQGHVVADCPVLKRKHERQEKLHVKSVGVLSTSEDAPQSGGCYKPFLSSGSLSVGEGDQSANEVVILRDTGASLSLVRESVLPLSDKTFTGTYALCQGLDLSYVQIPLHYVYLRSGLVTGRIKVGVRSVLPLKGVDVLLGNDVAGGNVVPTIEVGEECDSCQSDGLAVRHPDVFAACVVTRSQERKKQQEGNVALADSFMAQLDVGDDSKTKRLTDMVMGFSGERHVTRDQLIEAQRTDKSLQACYDAVRVCSMSGRRGAQYFLEDGMLVRKWTAQGTAYEAIVQIVVPLVFRRLVLQTAHDVPWSGHMGIRKTYHRVLQNFFWPGLKADVKEYCSSCETCQKVGKPNQVIPPVPLRPIPVVGEPFDTILMDCVGPLPKTKAGNQYLLTIMCMSTRFPEAIPLRRITAVTVLKAFTKFFTTFGLPRVIQTDQGTNFMSRIFQKVIRDLGIQHRTSSPYHPQSQGALERFHQSLKTMLKAYCLNSGKDWDEGVPFVLFASREAVQESLRFSPAQLVFGHVVRGPLKLLRDALSSTPSAPMNVLDYASTFRERWHKACKFAADMLTKSQLAMKSRYDMKAVSREFTAGMQVLVLLPVKGASLSSRFMGPYQIKKRLSETDYLIDMPDRKRRFRVCHINMLKPFRGAVAEPVVIPKTPEVVKDVAVVATVERDHEELLLDADTSTTNIGVRLVNSRLLQALEQGKTSMLHDLTEEQRAELIAVIKDFTIVFGDVPTRTAELAHDIKVTREIPLKQHPYRVNAQKREVLRNEVSYLLEHGLAIHSKSPWSSPCVLVPKPDGSFRLCTDYRRLNAITVTDSFPLPRIDDCVDAIGDARFVTKLDLLKGYWQVPLTPRASELSAFVTPDAFLQYTVMPFGLKNAPATFQRLVNGVFANLPGCTAYLDDVVVYSWDWTSHLQLLREVFARLARASLTVNLAKCDFARATVTYLGLQVGHGHVCPLAQKVKAILDFPRPTTRRELRRFLGMMGYYRGFCKNFSTVAEPLTALLSPKATFRWPPDAQAAFNSVKSLLCSAPVLKAPDFAKPFKLEVDASGVGAGAVLLQEDKGLDHPVCYYSHKFSECQTRYSTIEREALALLLALRHFEVYVGSSTSPVVVYTDHNPLVFLSRMYNQNQRLMRWFLIMQEYNLEMRHKKGADNKVADALSR